MLSTLALTALFAAGDAAVPGTHLTYAGTLAAVKSDDNPATKKFDLHFLVLAPGGDAGWVLEESGRGGWTWLDHFGRLSATLPALLYQRDDGRSVVPILAPFFPSPPVALERGATWEHERLEYRIAADAMRAGRSCWIIDVRSPYGHKRTIWVERESLLVVALRETVFMGQGQEHRLLLELTASDTLPPADLDQAATTLDAWIGLREKLSWKTRDLRTDLRPDQIATLKQELPQLAPKRRAADGSSQSGASDAFFAPIALAAEKDAQSQRSRAGAIAALRATAVGQPLNDLTLRDLAGKTLSAADVRGKVLVLHFWEYRDSPLEEPYGQTGYLDYLLRRRGSDAVAVYGVHVDARLADDAGKGASLAAARRLKAFMNLSYPILLDDGGLLRRVGDPRPTGSKLPLFVVIGKDGRIAEYHPGIYDVKANEGLAELDAAIAKALQAE